MNFTDRQIAIFAAVAAVVAAAAAVGAFFVAGLALWQTRIQYSEDYAASAIISPGVIPLKTIPSDSALPILITVVNTSKTNLSYFLKVESNLAYVSGTDGKPKLLPFSYESSITTLSKPESGLHKKEHELKIRAPLDAAEAPGIEPKYFLEFKVIDASNGKTLALSKCYYEYIRESKTMNLFQPVMVVGFDENLYRASCKA